jgi:hypothetical protein
MSRQPRSASIDLRPVYHRLEGGGGVEEQQVDLEVEQVRDLVEHPHADAPPDPVEQTVPAVELIAPSPAARRRRRDRGAGVRHGGAVAKPSCTAGRRCALVFRSFLALSPVGGPWGHAGDAWFVDASICVKGVWSISE